MNVFPTTIFDHTILPGLFRPNPVIFDFGVNDGSFAAVMLKRFGASVYGAEPSSKLFGSLPSDPKLHFENIAVGGVDGTAILELYTERCASLHKGANDVSVGTEEVPVWSFATFLARSKVNEVDLLKVDIEGAECDLFEAAQDRDLVRCRQITVEFHDFLIPSLGPRVEAIKSRLEASGFRRINFSLNNGNVLFVRRDLLTPSFAFALRGPYKYALGIARRARRALRAG